MIYKLDFMSYISYNWVENKNFVSTKATDMVDFAGLEVGSISYLPNMKLWNPNLIIP